MMSHIVGAMPTWWTRNTLSNWADLLGVIGVAVSLVTLARVTRLRSALQQERVMMRSLYGLDTLQKLLKQAVDQLAEAGGSGTKNLVSQLDQMLGRVDGINRALAIAAPEDVPSPGDVRLVSTNYYSDEFVISACDEAQKCLDLLVYRNQQVSNAFLLEKLADASRAGVQVRVLAIASTASDASLDAARSIMPRPVPANIAQLRRQLADNEQCVIDFLHQQQGHSVEYRGYKCPPMVHMLRVDGEIRLGLVGTHSQAQPERLLDRPYLVMAVDSAPGAILVDHFNLLFNDADRIDKLGTHEHADDSEEPV